MHDHNEPEFAVRKTWIFSVFLIVPLVALFGGWDYFFNNQKLLPHLQFDSLFLPLYLLVFELPHVFASFLSFFQKEYITQYKKHLYLGIPLTLLLFLVLVGANFYLAITVYLIVTLFHVTRQLTGIAHFYGVPKNYWHGWWTWLLTAGLASMYIVMQPGFVPAAYHELLLIIVQITILLSAACGLRLLFDTKQTFGRWYIILAILMSAVSYGMLVLGYAFLSVLIVRVIHDVTAFMFYINHEMNNNNKLVQNWLYKYVPCLPWSLIVIVPAIAIGLGLILRSSIENVQVLFAIVMTVSFIHYYLESVIWKRDSLHRKNIRIE